MSTSFDCKSLCRLIHPYRRRGRETVVGADAADAVPWKCLIGRFALAFVALLEPRHEEFLGQRGQHDPTSLTVFDNFVGIVKIHDLNDGAGLRSVISDL